MHLWCGDLGKFPSIISAFVKSPSVLDTIRPNPLNARNRCPFDGFNISGKNRIVFSGGVIIWRDGFTRCDWIRHSRNNLNWVSLLRLQASFHLVDLSSLAKQALRQLRALVGERRSIGRYPMDLWNVNFCSSSDWTIFHNLNAPDSRLSTATMHLISRNITVSTVYAEAWCDQTVQGLYQFTFGV